MRNEILNLQKLLNEGNTEKAYQIASHGYQQNKNDLIFVKIFSFLCLQKENYELAIEVLEGFYGDKEDKKDFDFFANMGFAYKFLEDYENALAMYDQAKQINPDSPLCYLGPAEIYLKLRDFNQALKTIDIAIEKVIAQKQLNDLQFENAIKLKTDINLSLGRDQENEEMLGKLLAERFRSNLFYLLATIKPSLISEDFIERAKKGISMAETGFKNKLDRFWNIQPLFFGLAAYYQKKDQSASEHYYHLGNKEIMKTVRYNSFNYQKHISKIMDIYLKHFSNASPEIQELGKEHIFIVGSPRSGTTLIESIAASNDKIVSGGELLSLYKLSGKLIDTFDENDFRNKMTSLRDVYISRTNFLKGSYECIIDKLPENFLYLGLILNIFPKAKIIRTIRNPWDVAISLYKQRYVTNIPYSASFFNIGVFMANYEAINIFWDEQLSQSKNILDVRYEDLANKTIDHQYIYEFLEINSNYDEQKRERFFSQTASIRQIGNQIHSQSIEKKEFLDKKTEFIDSLKMQRDYWYKKGIKSKDNSFFGYTID
jgi:tetratricopeptide (TPR) repeat protein